eukprot:CAMPEP_0181418064 /NCGR_PEP_ID=MMETSP1110-20121109/11362_1 /TAXON_ID=174948 /ORGANISM="Symbiodinium sp., Strain CCMP421" /LENGTH=94 /DNA_ID=CAMNT_0023541031 /DNA_START=227 /DNA_END=508 /DNA_ORIENTATION=+
MSGALSSSGGGTGGFLSMKDRVSICSISSCANAAVGSTEDKRRMHATADAHGVQARVSRCATDASGAFAQLLDASELRPVQRHSNGPQNAWGRT